MGRLWDNFGESYRKEEKEKMRIQKFKGRCVKKSFDKCTSVCKTYDELQLAYAEKLQSDNTIKRFSCNIPLDDSEYMTDFLCVKNDNTIYVCECVKRNLLSRPQTLKLLDLSKEYWLNHKVEDWRIITNEA